MKLPSCLAVLIFTVAVNFSAKADMLVSGFSSDAVHRFSSSGASLGVFATHSTMDGPTALVYNSAGELLVLNTFSLNVLRFDGASGAYLGTLITPTSLGSVGLTDPNDMELGPDGNLYMMSHHNDGANIFKFDSLTGAYLGIFAASPPVRHQHGLAFGSGGHLYQGNVATGYVERFDGVTGAFMGVFTGGPPIGSIGDLIFGPSHLYVASEGAGGVARYDASSGTFLGYLIPAGSSHWGMTIDGGVLYVSNVTSGEIRKYDTATDAYLGSFISTGPGAADLLAMPVPEPASAAMVLAGLALVVRRRRGSNTRR